MLVRHDDGRICTLPVQAWLGGHAADHQFDRSLIAMCHGPTIEFGLRPETIGG